MNASFTRQAVCLATVCLLLAAHSTAAADTRELSTPGSLHVEGRDGELVEMPLISTDVRVEITAFVARAVIEQTFVNPFAEPIEAVYTFPLGDRAAVDDFELVVGERSIRGEIRRRAEARQIYETARRGGFHAALLEQERPNIFTQSVANIEPGKPISVRLQTVEPVPYAYGVYQWIFPLVVGPRYIPGSPKTTKESDSVDANDGPEPKTPGRADTLPAWRPTDRVPDADKATAPVLKRGRRTAHEVSIHVTLDAGVPIRSIESTSHRIGSTKSTESKATVELEREDRLPNKDFVLRWNVSAERPQVGFLAHRSGVDGFFTLLVQPKGRIDLDDAVAKEIVLVLDTSGSMSGLPLNASKRFVKRALRQLGSRDTFNLVRFAGRAEIFSSEPLANEPESIDRALNWIDDLKGGGGTNMLKGFRAAFVRPPDPDRLRMVVFLTDGYIGNEQEILSAISRVVGEARIFTLGIGSSVNHYLLDRMARMGSGAHVVVRHDENVKRAVDAFHDWVSKPCLTDIEIDWGALPILDTLPDRPRDLYSGQTLNVVGRFVGGGDGEIVVRGRLGGGYWEQRVPVSLPERREDHASLASVWARRRIEELKLDSPEGVPPALEASITALALEYRLMTRYTSFVAVDEAEVVNTSGETRRVRQALPIPDGVSLEGVFGTEGPAGLRVEQTEPQYPPPPAPAVERRPIEPKPRSEPIPGTAVEIELVILDSGGDPLPGATVTLTDLSGAATTLISDAQGHARFVGLHPGPGYAVDVHFMGFGTRRETNLRLRRGARKIVLIQLVEEMTERVRVVATSDVVQLGSTSHSTKFSDEYVQSLPVPGRFYQNTLTLAPGVQDPDGKGDPNVHGSRSRDFRAEAGGVSNVDPLTGQFMGLVDFDAIEEMSVITGGSGVEFSRAQGGFTRLIQKQDATAATPGAVRTDDGRLVLDAAWRVLADLAEDGLLSPAEGVPAVAAILAAQGEDGSFARHVGAHAIATWAIAEVRYARPDETWIIEAVRRAERYLEAIEIEGGWPRRLGQPADEETTLWVQTILCWLRDEPNANCQPKESAPETLAYSRLQAAVAGYTLPSAGTGYAPLDRFVGSFRKGNLTLAH